VADRRAPEREWVSFEDEDEYRTWVFDVTFLLSRWSCIYGNGCQGVLTGPTPEREQGCCSYGAHFTDQADADRVVAVATTLDAAEWQFRSEGLRKGIVKKSSSSKDGEPRVTRMVDEACLFLNRPGFEGGVGCALHLAAIRRGERPMDYKPDVCWQLPLRRDDREDGDGHVISTIGEWGRSGWGEGGAEFHWWCTEAREAFAGSEPLFRTMVAELEAMVGEAVHRRLVAYLDVRVAGGVPLPHPAVR